MGTTLPILICYSFFTVCKWRQSQTLSIKGTRDIVLLSSPLKGTPLSALCTTYAHRQQCRLQAHKVVHLKQFPSMPLHAYFITASIKSQRNKECLARQLFLCPTSFLVQPLLFLLQIRREMDRESVVRVKARLYKMWVCIIKHGMVKMTKVPHWENIVFLNSNPFLVVSSLYSFLIFDLSTSHRFCELS